MISFYSTSTVENPEYSDKVRSVYIDVGYQIAGTKNIAVNLATITVGLVFDDTGNNYESMTYIHS
jgi:hypothetical protein